MPVQHLEVERKYDVPTGTRIPALPSDDRLVRRDELLAVYWDTADLALQRARVTLRRRSGGKDAGWHLKLPAGRARLELRTEGDEETVPAELLALVRAATRGAPLLPVATLATTRTVHPVLDDAGRILVEVVDDDVRGQGLLEDRALAWREWEAELVAGDTGDLDEVDGALRGAGATPADSPSKVGRLLQVAAPAAPRLTRRSTAADVLHEHLAGQVAELVRRDPQVRLDQDDAVHKMRVATRRLRSALSTFNDLLDPGLSAGLGDELRWLADVLGGARDTEVMHARLRALLAGEPPELLLGHVVADVDDVMTARYRAAHAAVVEVLDGQRYLDLLARLDALVAQPSSVPAARQRAAQALLPAVRRRDRSLTKALRAADRERDPDARDLLLHEARKKAKRTRYAAEAVQAVFGKPAKRFAAATTALQEVLGEHQDGVVTRGVLRELGELSGRSGRNGFTLGRLHALEQVRAEQLQADDSRLAKVQRAAARQKLRRWLKG